MKTVYICKNCGQITTNYDIFISLNSGLGYCPHCYRKSESTDVGGWADISYVSFDQDIQNSIENGSFDNAFPEIAG